MPSHKSCSLSTHPSEKFDAGVCLSELGFEFDRMDWHSFYVFASGSMPQGRMRPTRVYQLSVTSKTSLAPFNEGSSGLN